MFDVFIKNRFAQDMETGCIDFKGEAGLMLSRLRIQLHLRENLGSDFLN